jgi:glycosyltransferase involved in cell wall biosynthesis
LPGLDALVLPSFTEGLPNVVLEAFAAEIPVVATATGGTPEVVTDGVNGYLVPPGDPDALARRIGDVLASEERRRAMGRQGRQRIEEEFTFETQARGYARLFAELTEGASAPSKAEGRATPVASEV